MTDHPIRLFPDDAAVERVGQGLLNADLPRAEWTHEAHLAATLWLLLRRTDIDLDREIRTLISRYNEAAGGINDDRQGYHDTITRAYLRGVRLFLEEADATRPLDRLANELLHSPMGRRDWPMRFWSKDRLFSVEARQAFVEPDLCLMP